MNLNYWSFNKDVRLLFSLLVLVRPLQDRRKVNGIWHTAHILKKKNLPDTYSYKNDLYTCKKKIPSIG